VLGIIPFVDFFFQANKYSAKLFEEHLKRLEQIAIEK